MFHTQFFDPGHLFQALNAFLFEVEDELWKEFEATIV